MEQEPAARVSDQRLQRVHDRADPDQIPNLKSIRDLAAPSPPWSLKFFTLFGKDTHLDNIEHDMIRAEGVISTIRASIRRGGLRIDRLPDAA